VKASFSAALAALWLTPLTLPAQVDAATAPAIPAPAAQAPAVQFYDGSFECYAGPLALRLPDSYAELLRLGPVRGTRDVRVQTQRRLTTTERRIDFQGLSIDVYLFSADPGRYQVVSVRIEGSQWQLSPLRVGQMTDAVTLPRGWPGLPHQSGWEVQGDSAHLIVSVNAGHISAVDYLCDAAH
jgi:hypothetical protein